MVKVGFITEGFTEKVIVKSEAFQTFLTKNGLVFVHEVIVADGNGNLTNDKLVANVSILRDQGAEVIVILRDLDDAVCVVDARNKTMQDSDLRVCVAVRAIEAWFLSDTAAMQSFLHTSEFYEEFPEQENNPFERIKHWSQMFRGRGVQDKKILARNMVHNSNFSIENAAAHPNCHSAKYFIEKLKSLSTR